MDLKRPFEIQSLPIEIKQGSTLSVPITYKDSDDEVIVLTGYTAKLCVRRTFNSDGDPDIDLTTENGGITITAETGLILLTFVPDDTLELDAGYEGEWDLFLIPESSTPYCILQGTLVVKASSTRIDET